ncbi:hypothetical protein IXO221_010250 [Xanthomonas oryzae pv. oryzae]|nr:hypothetical protein [Xanthomonas oryzae]UXW14153.1 hypothetical protein IXO221_010250 [Xanthomonas oryzae pv. oryzae]
MMVGANAAASTKKSTALAAVAVPTVTETGPVVAPAGTVVVNSLAVAAEVVAETPLNFIAFCAAVVLKPCPLILLIRHQPT